MQFKSTEKPPFDQIIVWWRSGHETIHQFVQRYYSNITFISSLAHKLLRWINNSNLLNDVRILSALHPPKQIPLCDIISVYHRTATRVASATAFATHHHYRHHYRRVKTHGPESTRWALAACWHGWQSHRAREKRARMGYKQHRGMTHL